ncbi:unnamed protein product, partial [Amoebophrya sp. A25]
STTTTTVPTLNVALGFQMDTSQDPCAMATNRTFLISFCQSTEVFPTLAECETAVDKGDIIVDMGTDCNGGSTLLIEKAGQHSYGRTTTAADFSSSLTLTGGKSTA